MTAAMSDMPHAHIWTTDDLDGLPDDGVRRELLDGVLLVSPSPTDVHQIVAGRLMVALEDSCPPEFQVTQGVEVRLSTRRSFIPDVLVATEEAARRRSRIYAPHEVMLAVEIVSPSSVSMDRITKPALYAAAGIPHYWIVDTEPSLSVQAYRLDAGMYRSAGAFTAEITLDEPWPICVSIKNLTPRFL
jgi:Uma2 family endonuclease